jgi:hypothetical protein
MLFGQPSPRWIDGQWRALSYPPDDYFTGFISEKAVPGEPQDKATIRMEMEAKRKIAESIKVNIESAQSIREESMQGNRTPDWFVELYMSTINISANAEITGLTVESYYDKKTKLHYAFAYAGKRELVNYHAATLASDVEQIKSLLKTAAQLEEQHEKVKARKQYEAAAALWGKTANALDLLRALGSSRAGGLPQTTWLALREEIMQALVRTEISVFVNSREAIFGKPSAIIANKLKAQLAEHGYRFTAEEQAADYTLHIHATTRKIGDPHGIIVFCYADVALEWVDNHTGKTVYKNEQSYKGGSTTWEDAGREAMEAAAEIDVKM